MYIFSDFVSTACISYASSRISTFDIAAVFLAATHATGLLSVGLRAAYVAGLAPCLLAALTLWATRLSTYLCALPLHRSTGYRAGTLRPDSRNIKPDQLDCSRAQALECSIYRPGLRRTHEDLSFAPVACPVHCRATSIPEASSIGTSHIAGLTPSFFSYASKDCA